MAVKEQYRTDVEAILSHRHDNGADYWATPDRRLIKGAPFSTLECMSYLLELGMEADDPVLQGALELLFSTWQADGRFRLYPKSTPLPCQIAPAARVLCQAGYASDPRIEKTLEHLLQTRYTDGGWRCNKFFFGRGPETEHSNPLPTLNALDALRYHPVLRNEQSLDTAVEFLLSHWDTRVPIGPCHYGIGTLFMQVSYPFRDYNLFLYVYVLSYYARAREDRRFLEAFHALEAKTVDGQVVVERVVPKLAGLEFCRKGAPSALATERYQEIVRNLGQ